MEAAEVGLRIAGALWRFWYVRGYLSEGREQLAGVLALSTLPTSSNVSTVSSAQAPAPASQSQSWQSFRAKALNGAGNLVYSQGDYAAARSLHEESLAIRRELGDKSGIAASLHNLGNVAYSQGEYAAARSLYEESLSIKRELGDKRDIAVCLAGLGGVAAGMGQALRGARLLGGVEALLEAVGAVLQPEDRIPYEQGVGSARAQLGEEEFERAWQEGRAMSMEEAVEYALGES